MEFKKFPSLTNAYMTKFLAMIKEQGLGLFDEWVVYEKVHGSNFSLHYDGETLKAARRTSFLDEHEKFHGYKAVIETHREDIIKLWEVLGKPAHLAVYGELFGGSYAHKDVQAIQTSRIQKGIEYCLDVRFFVFDISVNDNILGADSFKMLMKDSNFFEAKELFRGTLEECLEYGDTFQTTIPERLELPPIEDNICEGTVIKPILTTFIGDNRVILKNKNDKWTEKAAAPKVKVSDTYSEEVKAMIENVSRFVTENRLKNVVSKEAELELKDFGKLLKLFNTDIIEDFLKEYSINDFSKVERSQITKSVNTFSAKMIRDNINAIVNGEF